MKFEITQLSDGNHEISATVKTASDMLNLMYLIKTHTEYTTDFDYFRGYTLEEKFPDLDINLMTNIAKIGDDVAFKCYVIIQNAQDNEQRNEVVNAVLSYLNEEE